MSTLNFEINGINTDWTMFLDRDGIINKRLIGKYVLDWKQFEFLPGVLGALALMAVHFDRIIIITNQQGIGKGLMNSEQLETIHLQMLKTIHEAGGRIDAVYYCPKLDTVVLNCRKPDPFMARQAKKDFPSIDFEKSIMVGDQPGDIEFGFNLNMKTVWIPESDKLQWNCETFKPDLIAPNLLAFTEMICRKTNI